MTTVKLTAPTTTLAYGQTAALHFAMDPAAQVAIRFEKRTSTTGTWALVATTTTDVNGLADFSVTPLVTTYYRVTVLATGATSGIVTMGVAKPTIRSTRRSVAKHASVTVSGIAATSDSNNSVKLQRMVRRRWTTVKTVAVSPKGRYRARVRLAHKRGTYAYRIVVTSAENRVLAASRSLHIRVR
jgi:5-hydroxyisourate hydrolase-like protein (transthyretin family)